MGYLADEQENIAAPSERGFGLIEVVIAMALLMIVSLAMLPVVISSLNLSKDNVSLTTATQLVAQKLDRARGLSPTCDAVHTFVGETLDNVVADPRGVVLVVTYSTETACPTSYPAAYPLTVTVTEQDTGRVVAQAETRIIIDSESEN